MNGSVDRYIPICSDWRCTLPHHQRPRATPRPGPVLPTVCAPAVGGRGRTGASHERDVGTKPTTSRDDGGAPTRQAGDRASGQGFNGRSSAEFTDPDAELDALTENLRTAARDGLPTSAMERRYIELTRRGRSSAELIAALVASVFLAGMVVLGVYVFVVLLFVQ